MNHSHLYAVDTLILTDDELTTLIFIACNDKELLDHCALSILCDLVDLHLITCETFNPVSFSLTDLGRHYLPAIAQTQAE